MNWDLIRDPMFRLPFATGLSLALTLPWLGLYAALRQERLAPLGLSQAAAAGAVMGAVLLKLPPMAGAGAGALAATLFKQKVSGKAESPWIWLMLAGWSAGLLTASVNPQGEMLHKALIEGELLFATPPHLWAAFAASALCALALTLLKRPLLMKELLPGRLLITPGAVWQSGLAFDLLNALVLAVAVLSMGLMSAFALIFLPAWGMMPRASSWRRATFAVSLAGGLGFSAAFLLSLGLDLPLAPVLVGLLALTACLSRLRVTSRSTH